MAKILIVEDDRDCRELLAELLHSFGHEITSVGTAEDGLEAASSRLPDVALLDLNLHGSGFDGYETMLRIRALPGGASIPIIAVSASLRRHGEKAMGFSEVVSKPYTFEQIMKAIQGVL